MGTPDATTHRWLKRATRGVPWRPEWLRKTHGRDSGPADAGVSAPPRTATVRPLSAEGATHRSAPSSRDRFHGARPSRHG